jgi:ABC-2 type transport system permease protein
MSGLLQHLILSLRLNFRSRQALVYGFVFPILFLFAFWGIYGKTTPPLRSEMGQLLTVTILSGACFGMPTALVAERERGVWRRYRLLPTGTGGIVITAMISRTLLIALAIIMQLILAHYVCGAVWPAHPLRLAAVFVFVAFAFLGLGLVIAMLADDVPAVQALGQIVFLPMLMVGGVGVKLSLLPEWARHMAAFMPGLYAVQSLDAALQPARSPAALPLGFCLVALTLIGSAGCFAGGMMFRWDAAERAPAKRRTWIAAALVPWLSVGAIAEGTGYLRSRAAAPAGASTLAATSPAPAWTSITDAQIETVAFDDLLPDWDKVTPVAQSLDNLDAAGGARMDAFSAALKTWPAGMATDQEQRVRNLLAVAAIADLIPDPHEYEITFLVFQHLRATTIETDLCRILTQICTHPSDGTIPSSVAALGIDGEVNEPEIRQRIEAYARKLLARLLDKPYYGRL